MMVFLVPPTFLNQDYVISEAPIAYIEVPKVALLRTLAGVISLLWSIEWAIKSSALQGSKSTMSFSTFSLASRVRCRDSSAVKMPWMNLSWTLFRRPTK